MKTLTLKEIENISVSGGLIVPVPVGSAGDAVCPAGYYMTGIRMGIYDVNLPGQIIRTTYIAAIICEPVDKDKLCK